MTDIHPNAARSDISFFSSPRLRGFITAAQPSRNRIHRPLISLFRASPGAPRPGRRNSLVFFLYPGCLRAPRRVFHSPRAGRILPPSALSIGPAPVRLPRGVGGPPPDPVSPKPGSGNPPAAGGGLAATGVGLAAMEGKPAFAGRKPSFTERWLFLLRRRPFVG
uniref:Uncharacterized protein n=1 Tax=Candidatus Kentrum eta TaxID=2126337 RepID=A0A450V216_9GAMM|nr:MAG: hypothetical protein BECKH772A_GA0070896_101488 [Candidatus Kentron sp. H]VFJ99118.1 MAG: hypothetical protein BECKH772B_GA0070898_101508 [Candidatus Kentron sp. H]VFK03746.1 MAG: hypothetical protein BECKH772C_GA0070978_101438 [Candidatus Kentron sp. H]